MRINLFGGPGVGKSTLAAALFAALKSEGVNIELVTERAKVRAWTGVPIAGWEQHTVFAEQLAAEAGPILAGASVVTDSPLWLQLAYAERDGYPACEEMAGVCRAFDKRHGPGVNFLLSRTVPYSRKGRYENVDAAADMDRRIKVVLDREQTNRYLTLDPRDLASALALIREVRG